MALLRSRNIVILSIILIAFGVLEILVGIYFTQQYFINSIYIYLVSALDVLYFISGALLLSMRKNAAKIVVVLLVCDMIGRLSLIGA